MKSYNLTYKPFGMHAILIEWPNKIDEKILNDIINFKNKITNTSNKVIVEITNTYSSLTIYYDTTIKNIYNEILTLKAIYKQSETQIESENRLWKIPVCYDVSFGIDLEEIATMNNLEIDEIIGLHTGSIYTVYFIGFLPGFLYLGELDSKLQIARKSTPRLHVDKGSVGIGGKQTGVYPQSSSGGWNIIGKTPVSLFDVSNEQPCFTMAGDKMQFTPINLNEYKQIETQVAIGLYEIKSELVNG